MPTMRRRWPSPAALPEPAFVEVHSENFFGDGGPALQDLQAARERWPVSLHGVGLALGSAAGLDAWHLDRLARLVERIDPVHVSDHACFGRAASRPGGPVHHACDLLPVAFTPASLAILVRQVQQVQERLRRPILVENLAAYNPLGRRCAGRAGVLQRPGPAQRLQPAARRQQPGGQCLQRPPR